MKRWPILFAIAAAAILFPANAADVGELLPVELIYIYREADQVCVATDTEAVGAGPDLNAAMEDLHATAPGAVFGHHERLPLSDGTPFAEFFPRDL